MVVNEFSDRPLELERLPIPTPGAGEILVKVDTAGIVFGETLIAKGLYQVRPKRPFVAGSEYSGTVIDTGRGVSQRTRGDKVAVSGFIGDPREDRRIVGSLAQYRSVPVENAVTVPDHIPMESAALFRSSFETARYALYLAKLQIGETMLVMGASGGAGYAAVQLGKIMGATVIASCSGEAKRRIAVAGGADEAVDSTSPNWREEIDRLTGGEGLDVVFDPVGGDQTERAFRSVGRGGRYMVIGFASGPIPQIPANLPLLKEARLMGANLLLGQKHEWDEIVRQRNELMRWFGEGRLTVPPVAQRFPLEEAQQAYDLVASGKTAGRVVVKMPGCEEIT